MLDLPVLELAADLRHLEPVQIAQRPAGALDAVADGLVDAPVELPTISVEPVGVVRHEGAPLRAWVTPYSTVPYPRPLRTASQAHHRQPLTFAIWSIPKSSTPVRALRSSPTSGPHPCPRTSPDRTGPLVRRVVCSPLLWCHRFPRQRLRDAPGDQERKTVTVWLMKDSASKEFLRRFTEDFEREHEDLRLDIRIQEWDRHRREGPRRAQGPTPGGRPGRHRGRQHPGAALRRRRPARGPHPESMRDWGKDAWLPGLAEPGKDGNKQYGIPWYAANRVVIYRKDLFEQAGIARPPRTRDDWLAATEKLNSGGTQGIYLAGQDWVHALRVHLGRGRRPRTGEGPHPAGHPRHPGRAARHGVLPPAQALGAGPADADEEHPPQAGVFAGGKVAQIIAVPGLAQAIVRQNPDLKGKIGFFPVPGRTAGRLGAVFTGGSDLVVPRNTDDQFAATAVVGALTGAKWDTELARTMNYVPNKTTLADAVAGEEGVAAMAVGAAHGQATPHTPQWADVEADNPIKDYMTRVLNGADPAAEARRASRKITEAPRPGRGLTTRTPLTAPRSGDSAKRPWASVHQCVSSSPAPASSPVTPSLRNLADTSVRSSSPAAKSTARSSAGTFTVCAVRERSRISIHSRSASHRATWSNASGSKSAPSSRSTTASTFLLNAAVTPAASSYARTSTSSSLTRSVPSSSPSPGASSARTEARNSARSAGSRLPIVPPRNASSRGPGVAGRASGAVKSAISAWTSSCGRSSIRARPAWVRALSLTSTGT